MLSGKVLAAVFFFLFAFVPYIAGQTRINSSGTGGLHVIQGRIFGPSGMSVDEQITVRLESNNFPTLSLNTDASGTYAFQNLAPGNYSVVVDAGERFETFRESVTIDQDVQPATGIRMPSNPKIFNVPVYLQLKRGQTVLNQVVNAKLANLPKDAVDHYQKGLDLGKNSKSEEAILEFRAALTSYSNFPECYVEIGKIELVRARLDDAVVAFQNAIRLDKNSFDAHVNLGITLMDQKKYDEAEPELVTAALLNRTAVTPHYYIGLMYTEKRQYDIAQKAFETAKSLPGGDTFPLIHRGLGGIYMRKGMNKQAVGELEKYLQLAPKARDADKIRQTITELKTKPEKLNVFS
jgi:tetratricopeptide (TPR) repeat protein